MQGFFTNLLKQGDSTSSQNSGDPTPNYGAPTPSPNVKEEQMSWYLKPDLELAARRIVLRLLANNLYWGCRDNAESANVLLQQALKLDKTCRNGIRPATSSKFTGSALYGLFMDLCNLCLEHSVYEENHSHWLLHERACTLLMHLFFVYDPVFRAGKYRLIIPMGQYAIVARSIMNLPDCIRPDLNYCSKDHPPAVWYACPGQSNQIAMDMMRLSSDEALNWQGENKPNLLVDLLRRHPVYLREGRVSTLKQIQFLCSPEISRNDGTGFAICDEWIWNGKVYTYPDYIIAACVSEFKLLRNIVSNAFERVQHSMRATPLVLRNTLVMYGIADVLFTIIENYLLKRPKQCL